MAKLTLALTLALTLLATQALSQSTTPTAKQDELRYNGNNGDNQDQSNNDGGRNNAFPISSPTPSSNGQLNDQRLDDPGQNGQQRPVNPFEMILPNFGGGFGGGYGLHGDDGFDDWFGDSGIFPSRTSLLSKLLSFANRPQLTQHFTGINKKIQELERQAAVGREESYFNHNGIEYVRTCETKKLSRGGQQGQPNQQAVPMEQQQQQQQRQQQNQ